VGPLGKDEEGGEGEKEGGEATRGKVWREGVPQCQNPELASLNLS